MIGAISEIEHGLVDADLGGALFKKRIAIPGHGKRASVRTLLAYRFRDKAIFVYGFAKSERSNINTKELRALKRLANELLAYGDPEVNIAIGAGELIELENSDG